MIKITMVSAKVFLLAAFLLAAPTLSAEAARITGIRGNQVIIRLPPHGNFRQGEVYTVMNNRQRIGQVRIRAIRGSQAQGEIIRGRAARNAQLVRGRGGSSQARQGPRRRPQPVVPRVSTRPQKKSTTNWSVGLLGGYSSYSQSLEVNDDSASLSLGLNGSGFNIKAYGLIPITPMIIIVPRMGMEFFAVSDDAELLELDNQAPATEVRYLSADVVVGLMLMNDQTFSPYFGVGVGILHPLSSESTIFDEDGISTASYLLGALGLKFQFTDSFHAIVQGEYNFIPSSNEIKTSFISGQIGLGMSF